MTYHVYILFNRRNGTLYVGVTGDLKRRIWEHRNGVHEGFSNRYDVVHLGYCEAFGDIRAAIRREKQLKAGSRSDKLALIEKDNPTWQDLAEKWGWF